MPCTRSTSTDVGCISGSICVSVRKSDTKRLTDAIKNKLGPNCFDGLRFAEIGHLDGRVVEAFCEAFQFEGALGIDCAMEAKVGETNFGGVPTSLMRADMLKLQSFNGVDIVFVCTAAMNFELQLVAAHLASISTDVKYLIWYNQWELRHSHTQLLNQVCIGAFSGRTANDPLMEPVASSSCTFGSEGTYMANVYDMGAMRDRLQQSVADICSYTTSLMEAPGVQSQFTRSSLNPKGPDGEPLSVTWQWVIDTNWMPTKPLVSLELSRRWSDRKVASLKRSYDDQIASLELNVQTWQRLCNQYQEAVMPRINEIQNAMNPRNDQMEPPARRKRKMQRKAGEAFSNKQRTALRKAFTEFCDRAGVDISTNAAAEANIGDLLYLLQNCIRYKSTRRALLRTEDAADVEEDLFDKVKAILLSATQDDARTALEQLATVPIGVSDEFVRRNVDGILVSKLDRPWTLKHKLCRVYQRELKTKLSTPALWGIMMDDAIVSYKAVDFARKVFLFVGADIMPSSATIRLQGKRVLEEIEERRGCKIVSSIPDGEEPQRGESAWHLDAYQRIKDIVTGYVKTHPDATTITLKATGDKVVMASDLHTFVYGLASAMPLEPDGPGLQSLRRQYVCGMYACNADPLSKKGDSLCDQRRYLSAFDKDRDRAQAEGFVVDGRAINVNIVSSGDWDYLNQAVSGGSESNRGRYSCPCLECALPKSQWTRVDESGIPVEIPRLEIAKKDQYALNLSQFIEDCNSVPPLPHERHELHGFAKERLAGKRSIAKRYLAEYAPTNAQVTELELDTHIDKLTASACRDFCEKVEAYFGLTSDDVAVLLSDRSSREKVSETRLRDILRLLGEREAAEGEADTLISALSSIFTKRDSMLAEWSKVKLLDKLNNAGRIKYDNFCLCLAHLVARLRGHCFDMVLREADNSEEAIGGLNRLIRSIISRMKVRDGKFKVLMTDNEHVKSQPLYWQHAKAVSEGIGPILDVVYAKDPERSAKVLELFTALEEYIRVISVKSDFTPEDFAREKSLRGVFGKLGVDLWGSRFTAGIYVHKAICGHVAYHMHRWGNLARFSNQGWERKNGEMKRARYNCTSRGGYKSIAGYNASESDASPERADDLLALMRREQRLGCVLSNRADEAVRGILNVHPNCEHAKDLVQGRKRKRVRGDVGSSDQSGDSNKMLKTIYPRRTFKTED